MRASVPPPPHRARAHYNFDHRNDHDPPQQPRPTTPTTTPTTATDNDVQDHPDSHLPLYTSPGSLSPPPGVFLKIAGTSCSLTPRTGTPSTQTLLPSSPTLPSITTVSLVNFRTRSFFTVFSARAFDSCRFQRASQSPCLRSPTQRVLWLFPFLACFGEKLIGACNPMVMSGVGLQARTSR